MNNPIIRIDKALKTKEDMQSFVLVALILFILFVKCYMVFVGTEADKTANNQQNINLVKTTSERNI